MICVSCINERHDHCLNFYDNEGKKKRKAERTKTWCDCEHKTGVYIDQKVCKHLKLTDPGLFACPSCGMDVEVEVNTTRTHKVELEEATNGASPDG